MAAKKTAEEAAAATTHAGNFMKQTLGAATEAVTAPVKKIADQATQAAAAVAASPIGAVVKEAAKVAAPVNQTLMNEAGINVISNDGSIQAGGARHEGPTGQGMVLGASVFALAGGAAIKLAVDYLFPAQ